MKSAAAFVCVICLSVILCGASARAQLEQPAAVPRFERGKSVEVAGMELFDRIVYLPASVNGVGPFTFVLDTGAGALSALDYSVASLIGLRQSLLMKGGGAGEDAVDIFRVDSAAVALEGLAFDPRIVAGIPLHRMDPHWGKRKDGLVGGDLLSTLVTVIDYERAKLAFHDATSYEYEGPGERIPVQVMGGYLFLEVGLVPYGADEPVSAFMMLDTGVRMTLFNTPFSKEHGLAGQSPATVTGVTGFGLGGLSRGVIGRVKEIRIGSQRIENPVVDFSTDTTGVLASPDFSGIIGADILSRFTLVLDYKRSQIVLEKNGAFAAPFEFDMCGIRFVMEGERFDAYRVFAIYEGSPAAEAGVKEGDLVTAIDGRPPASYTKDGLRDYLQRDGETVRLTVKRGEEESEMAVRLRRMI